MIETWFVGISDRDAVLADEDMAALDGFDRCKADDEGFVDTNEVFVRQSVFLILQAH